MSALLYLDRLSDADLGLLAGRGDVAALRRDPELLSAALGRPDVFDALFGAPDREPFALASPFLIFAVLVARAQRELPEAGSVAEWIGPRQRVPVFDTDVLTDFLTDPMRRLFLADLLASYSHVTSGSVWVRERRGWRRRRFSELDPIGLARLMDLVPEHQRLGVQRRLGDVSLFLAGVFPDYAGSRLLSPVQVERLLAAVDPDAETSEASGTVGLLEAVGCWAYQQVATASTGSRMGEVLGQVVERFGHARRVLSFLTDRYLFPRRERWFGLG